MGVPDPLHDRSRAGRAFADPALADRAFADPALADPALADRALAERLVNAGIAGPHRSHSREDNLAKAEMLRGGDPKATFGFAAAAQVTPREALAAVAKATGAPEPGDAYIDPQATIAAVRDAAARFLGAGGGEARVLVATGHPTGLLPLYMRFVAALRRQGAHILRPLEDVRFTDPDGAWRLRYLGGVGVLTDGGSLLHTHAPWAMEAVLASGEEIDLVVGDHGFAGAALERGIPVVAAMDSNDHALAVAWAGGSDAVLLPLDDNRLPDGYLPLADLVDHILEASEDRRPS